MFVEPPRDAARRTANAVLAPLFALAIVAPLAHQLTRADGPAAAVAAERRAPEPRPDWEWERPAIETWPRRFEAWYADAFGFRTPLVRAHNLAYWFALDVSPNPSIHKGLDGWLYYSGNETLEQIRGAKPFAAAELDAWRAMLEERRDWLAERGIEYLFVLGPTKGRVYPEHLQPAYRARGAGRLEQLLAHLAATSDVRVLDLTPALVAEKANDRSGDGDFVFFPLGTHWTHRGAFVTTRALTGALGVPAPEREEYDVRLTKQQGDTWADRLYMEPELTQSHRVWVPKDGAPRFTTIPYGRFARRYELAGREGLPRVLLWHDSYAGYVRGQLARHCSVLTCYWTHDWELARIEAERPDVVVDMAVERFLVTADPALLAPEDMRELEALFTASARSVVRVDAAADSAGVVPVGPAGNRFEPVTDGAAVGGGVRIPPGAAYELFDTSPLASYDHSSEDLVVRIDVTAPAEAFLELTFPGARGFPRDRGERVFVRPGRQVLYVRASGGRARAGPIRAGSEARPGDWIVHALEARVVARR